MMSWVGGIAGPSQKRLRGAAGPVPRSGEELLVFHGKDNEAPGALVGNSGEEVWWGARVESSCGEVWRVLHRKRR